MGGGAAPPYQIARALFLEKRQELTAKHAKHANKVPTRPFACLGFFAVKSSFCSGERGGPDRPFRCLAENSWSTPLLTHRPRSNPAGTGWRDASQGDRVRRRCAIARQDGRGPQHAESLQISSLYGFRRSGWDRHCATPVFGNEAMIQGVAALRPPDGVAQDEIQGEDSRARRSLALAMEVQEFEVEGKKKD